VSKFVTFDLKAVTSDVTAASGCSCRLAQCIKQFFHFITYICPLPCAAVHFNHQAGSNRLGGNWGFLALLPQLTSLALHSCYKVTNDTLAAFTKALYNSCDSSDHGPAGTVSSNNALLQEPTSQTTAAAAAAVLPLRRLELSYTRVSDAGMSHLAVALPQLRWLGLKGCNVGDDGLLHLLQLQQLTALHIKHCHR
jgi:hypothetical protein